MKNTFAIALLGASVAFARQQLPSDATRFMNWCAKNGKMYGSAVEMAERKANWFRTDAEILRLTEEHPSLRFKHNPYSDNSQADWEAMLGTRPEHSTEGARRLQEEGTSTSLNEQLSINWRSTNNPKGAVMAGPIKNQG